MIRSRTPSGTNLLGLVKHLAAVEYGWFCDTFGRPTEPLPFDDDDPDADLQVRPDETTEDVLAFYGRAGPWPTRPIDELELEATGTRLVRRRGLDALGADPHDRGRPGTPATSTSSASSSTG